MGTEGMPEYDRRKAVRIVPLGTLRYVINPCDTGL
jgi:hypothetical protein